MKLSYGRAAADADTLTGTGAGTPVVARAGSGVVERLVFRATNQITARGLARVLIGGVWVLAAALGSPASAAESYVGAERCKSCHSFEYQMWERSAHHRAQSALNTEQRADPKCNTCHTMAAEAGDNDTSIDCERCHGPGRYYYPSYVMKDRELARAVWLVDPNAAHCTQCHTEGTPSIRPFNYEEMWAKIDHSAAARHAWLKARVREHSTPAAPGAKGTPATTATPSAASGTKPRSK
jgi:hypothetical protein